jgi:fibronectin type 3 domain-containing protein
MANHSNTISWTASLDTVDGYNVYRGDTTGAESTTALNTALITADTYVDDTVAVGHAYFYEVRSSANGVLSSASNEISSPVILPLPPTSVVLSASV